MQKNGNLHFSIVGNGKIMYILADFGYKKSDRNVNINLEDLTRQIFNIIVTDIGNNRF